MSLANTKLGEVNVILSPKGVKYLSKLGYQAYGGREPLTSFEQGDFQLVITDLKMPDMDGMELLDVVGKLDSRVIVMVITGYGTIKSAVAATKKGAYDFIAKYNTLRAAVRWSLLPLVGVSWVALNLGPRVTLALMVLLICLMADIALITIRRMRIRRQV